MDFYERYNPQMDITQIISANLSAWMADNPSLDTIQKLSKASHVGFGTVRRTKNGDANITVQNLDAIAHAFKRTAIDLLAEPDNAHRVMQPPAMYVVPSIPDDERELLQGYRDASPDVREIMLEAARRAIKKHNSPRSETQ
jgi:transcriptional regulator with XRE-family HTH domain